MAQPIAAETNIITNVPNMTETIHRGAVWMNFFSKRTPRLTPITNCAALDNSVGTADQCWPDRVNAIEANMAPMNHGLARLNRVMSHAPAPEANAK